MTNNHVLVEEAITEDVLALSLPLSRQTPFLLNKNIQKDQNDIGKWQWQHIGSNAPQQQKDKDYRTKQEPMIDHKKKRIRP